MYASVTNYLAWATWDSTSLTPAACTATAATAGGNFALLNQYALYPNTSMYYQYFARCYWCTGDGCATGYQAVGSCSGTEVLVYGNHPAPLPTPHPAILTAQQYMSSTLYASLPQATVHVGDTFVVNISANLPLEFQVAAYTAELSFNTSAFTVSCFAAPGGRSSLLTHQFYNPDSLFTSCGPAIYGYGYQLVQTCEVVVKTSASGASWTFQLAMTELDVPGGAQFCRKPNCAPAKVTDFRGGWNDVGYINVA